MRTIDDATPLNGGEVDVAARIGWISRMARVTATDAGDTRLQAMSTRIGSSAAHLSRVETGQRRDSGLTHRYETALGLPEGALWAPVATLCRAFPRQSPRDSNPVTADTGVHTFSHLTARLLDRTEVVTGNDWLRWARSLSMEGNIGLPVELFSDVAYRLASELARSVSHAYPSRYEALALVRCSHYGDLFLDVVRTAFASGDAHGRTDLVSVIGEAVTPDAVKWALTLLDDEATALHGALTLETMGQSGAPRFWDELAGPLVAAFDASAPGSTQEIWTTHVIRLVPREVWRDTGAKPSRPLPSGTTPETYTRSADNSLWAWCVEQADAITTPLGTGPQPLLARLLFEIAFGPWETRALTSYLLIDAVGCLSESVAQRLATYAEENPHSLSRERVLRRLANLVHGKPIVGFEHWLTDDDPVLRNTALRVAGGSGTQLPEEVLISALLDPTTTREARYAAGMSTHPALDDLLDDPRLDQELRDELRWWRDKGGRIAL